LELLIAAQPNLTRLRIRPAGTRYALPGAEKFPAHDRAPDKGKFKTRILRTKREERGTRKTTIRRPDAGAANSKSGYPMP
jgi:hypothetical protein